MFLFVVGDWFDPWKGFDPRAEGVFGLVASSGFEAVDGAVSVWRVL